MRLRWIPLVLVVALFACTKKKFGQTCKEDGDCASDVCVEGACSEACSGTECPAGYSCRKMTVVTLGEQVQRTPIWVCRKGKADLGDPCGKDEDCRSGTCYRSRFELGGVPKLRPKELDDFDRLGTILPQKWPVHVYRAPRAATCRWS
jgi:hypothetical protein